MVFFILLLFLFLLPFLDGGTSFLAETLILILPLPLFLLAASRDELRFENLGKEIFLFCSCFLFFVFLSVIFSTSQIFSIPAFFQALAVFLWFILFLLLAKKENQRLVFWLVIITGLILGLVSFWHLLPQVKKPFSGMNLVYATYGHSHLADYLLLVIPLVLAFFLKAEKKLRLIYGGLLVFYLLSFILTFSRGAFLVLPPVVLLLIFLSKPKEAKQKILSWLLVLIPVGLLVLIAIFSLSSFGLDAKLAQPQHWLVKQLVKPEFQAKRLDYWQQALEGFKNRPLFGFGWGTFEIVALRFQKTTAGWSNFTHNFYLQTLTEGGIFALLSFLGFLVLSLRLIWKLLKKERDNPFLLGGLGAILASSLHSLVDYDWHFPAIFLPFLFLLASLLALSSRGVKGQSPPRWKEMGMGFLCLLVFVFGQTQLLGEYFYQKGDFEKALLISPWPVIRVRQIGDKIFEKNPALGEKWEGRILALSLGDPSMHYWLAEKYYYAGNFKKATEYYQKAIEYNPLGNYFLYPKLGELYDQIGEKKKKEDLFLFFIKKMDASKDLKSITQGEAAALLYLLGEELLNKGKPTEAIFWWRNAVKVAPEWSYFHLELARLYLDLGHQKESEKILKDCLKFSSSKRHCQLYLDYGPSDFGLESVGFWRKEILKIGKSE